MEKLFAIALGLGQVMYGKWLVQRLVSGVILLSSLVIVACTMVCAMLIGGFYAAYLALMNAGFEPVVSIIIIGSAALSITALLVFSVVWYLNRLRRLPGRVLKEKLPLASEANELIDAFLKGLMGTSAHPSSK